MNLASKTYKRTAKQFDRERLILDNIDYVGRILSTMTIAVQNADERENLHSAGVVGLVEAANKFDPSQKIPFRTFAFRRIHGAIIDELRKLSPVSQGVLKQIGMLKKVYEKLPAPVTPEQLAEASGLELPQVVKCLEAMRFLKPDEWNDFSSVPHQSWLANDGDSINAAEKEEMKIQLSEAIKELPERERLVLTLYYSEELKLKEIGAVIDISESRVSRILAAAKFRLKELVRARSN